MSHAIPSLPQAAVRLDKWPQRILISAIVLAPLITSVESSGTTFINSIIRQELDLNYPQMQWLSTGYWIFAIAFMIILGRLGDMFGRCQVILGSLVVYLAGTILASIGTNLWLLIVGRVLQGFGTAGLIPNSIGLLKIIFPRLKQTRAFIYWATLNYSGYGLGPFLAGLFALANWRLLYWIVLPFIVYSFIVFAFFINVDRKQRRKIPLDYLGTLLLMGTLTTFTLLFSEGTFWGWGSAVIITLYAVVPSLFALLLISQFYVKFPILPMNMFRYRSFWTGLLLEGCAYFSLITLLFFYSQYTQAFLGKNYSAFLAGTTILPASIPILLGLFIPRKLIEWTGYKILFLMGSALFFAGLFMLYWVGPDTGYVNIWWRLLLCGLGALLLLTLNLSWAMRDVPTRDASLDSGTEQVMDRIGSLVGVGIGSVVYLQTLVGSVEGQLQSLGLQLTPDQIETIVSAQSTALSGLMGQLLPIALPAQLTTLEAGIHLALTQAFNNTMLLGAIGAAIVFFLVLLFIPQSAKP